MTHGSQKSRYWWQGPCLVDFSSSSPQWTSVEDRAARWSGSHDWSMIGGVVVVVSLELCGYLGPPRHMIGT